MDTRMINYILPALIAIAISCSNQTSKSEQLSDSSTVNISKFVLQDKIKGGWAGQVIGCTYGGQLSLNGTAL